MATVLQEDVGMEQAEVVEEEMQESLQCVDPPLEVFSQLPTFTGEQIVRMFEIISMTFSDLREIDEIECPICEKPMKPGKAWAFGYNWEHWDGKESVIQRLPQEVMKEISILPESS